MELVLGIDGGGTKTAAWLSAVDASTNERPLGRGMSGPGNPRAVGFESAFANIDLAVDHAFKDAATPRTKVRGACLALAGADRPVERDRLAKWCESKALAEHIVLTNDDEVDAWSTHFAGIVESPQSLFNSLSLQSLDSAHQT